MTVIPSPLARIFYVKHVLRLTVNREVKHYVYGKRQTEGSCVSSKRENLPFSTCLTLERSYSVYLVNKQEKSLIKSSLSVFWQSGSFILPFAAVNVMLNINTRNSVH